MEAGLQNFSFLLFSCIWKRGGDGDMWPVIGIQIREISFMHINLNICNEREKTRRPQRQLQDLSSTDREWFLRSKYSFSVTAFTYFGQLLYRSPWYRDSSHLWAYTPRPVPSAEGLCSPLVPWLTAILLDLCLNVTHPERPCQIDQPHFTQLACPVHRTVPSVRST